MNAAPLYAPRAEYIVKLSLGPRQFPAMYHFAGTGPADTTCASCAAFLPASDERRGRCARWIEHRGRGVSLMDRGVDRNWWRGLPTIYASSSSCKYWEAKVAEAAA
jgi:hypothetical protein